MMMIPLMAVIAPVTLGVKTVTVTVSAIRPLEVMMEAATVLLRKS